MIRKQSVKGCHSNIVPWHRSMTAKVAGSPKYPLNLEIELRIWFLDDSKHHCLSGQSHHTAKRSVARCRSLVQRCLQVIGTFIQGWGANYSLFQPESLASPDLSGGCLMPLSPTHKTRRLRYGCLTCRKYSALDHGSEGEPLESPAD